MKTKRYNLDDDHFLGFIETKMLSYPERLRLIAKLKQAYKGDELTDDAFEVMARQVEVFTENVTSCDVKHKPTGQEFKDVSELGLYNEGALLLNTLSAEFLKGETLGKSPGTS